MNTVHVRRRNCTKSFRSLVCKNSVCSTICQIKFGSITKCGTIRLTPAKHPLIHFIFTTWPHWIQNEASFAPVGFYTRQRRKKKADRLFHYCHDLQWPMESKYPKWFPLYNPGIIDQWPDEIANYRICRFDTMYFSCSFTFLFLYHTITIFMIFNLLL